MLSLYFSPAKKKGYHPSLLQEKVLTLPLAQPINCQYSLNHPTLKERSVTKYILKRIPFKDFTCPNWRQKWFIQGRSKWMHQRLKQGVPIKMIFRI
jgi:hypothetical protein